MMIEITKVTCGETVEIIGNDIEDIFMRDNLFEDYEAPEVRMVFDPKIRGHIMYLMKLTASIAKCRNKNSLSARFEALEGTIVRISPAFRVAA